MLNYFVYKNGLGNCWTALGTLNVDSGYLYVGFDPQFAEAGGVLPPTERNGGGQPHPWQQADLNHIRFVAHETNFQDFMLLTFEETTLRYWRVTGPVVEAPLHVWEAARTINGKGLVYDFYFKPEVVGGVAQPPKPFRVLPVRLVAEVPRDAIYTSVDSLASYQYLIRGTCRPLWRASGPTAAAHHPEMLKQQQARIPRCERIDEEEPFAAFVRLYLNELLHRYGPATQSPSPRLGDFAVDLDSASTVVMATLNPILVETAALAFVQDLGLTPDIGVGKGKDIIDVRARAAGPDGSFDAKIAEHAWATLQALHLKTADGDDTLRERLLKRGVLDIQCKAADRKANADGVLYFGFKGPGHDGLTSILLNDLETLLATGAWPNLRRFLAMQARILLGEWRAPSATPRDATTPNRPGVPNAD